MGTGRNTLGNSRIFNIANECYVIYLGVKTVNCVHNEILPMPDLRGQPNY